jgi:hypothetical protein
MIAAMFGMFPKIATQDYLIIWGCWPVIIRANGHFGHAPLLPQTQEIPGMTWDFFLCPRQESNLRPLVPESESGLSN